MWLSQAYQTRETPGGVAGLVDAAVGVMMAAEVADPVAAAEVWTREY